MRTRTSLIHICLGLVAITPVFAQSPMSTPVAATASTIIPPLVRYAGVAVRNDGKPQTGENSVTFLIYKDEKGGEPLWVETQSVAFDPTGKYEVHLGAMNPSGLPTELFANGAARWLEVQVSGGAPEARVLLTSVPYAMKAADAATLGGLPASAFVLAGSQVAALAATASTMASVTPDGTSTVTTTGGTSHYLPMFTGAITIGSSEIYDTGTSVGIGDKPNPSARLDVNGGIILRGGMTVSRTGNATSSKGYPSFGFDFYSNAYNSSSKATDNPHFILQSEPTGNNTSSTGATFNLLYSNLGDSPAETGLSINSSGIISFAKGQTLTSTSSNGTAIYGQSTAGDGIDGSSSSGDGVRGASVSAEGVQGTSSTADGVYGTTSGNTLNTAGVYGYVGKASGVLSGIAGVWGDAYAHVGVLGTSYQYAGVQGASQSSAGVEGNSTTGSGVFGGSTTGYGLQGASTNGSGIQASSTNGYGGLFTSSGILSTVAATNTGSGEAMYAQSSGDGSFGLYADAQGNSGYGVYGVATGGNDSDSNGEPIPKVGVYGNTDYGYGVYGYSSVETGVYGVNTSPSSQGSAALEAGFGAAVWADSSASQGDGVLAALVATADDNTAAQITNNSSQSTLYLHNNGSGGSGDSLTGVMQATGSKGTCGIGNHGDLTCTGQVKTLATTSSAHMVETYAMQSPENWMEDFGTGTLNSGAMTVAIDPAFIETANTAADYHVFLTPRGDSKGLYVSHLTATSFEVHESGSGGSSLSFDYRIVAKRRGYEAQRLTDVTEKFNAETARARSMQKMEAAARAKGLPDKKSRMPRIPQRPVTTPFVQPIQFGGATRPIGVASSAAQSGPGKSIAQR